MAGEDERTALAREMLTGNRYMVLGTADAEGTPWASPVWYAPYEYREFFWVSKPGARHSQNIAARPQISIVVFDSTVPISTGQAVYMPALAEQVTDAAEIERGMEVFSRRSVEQGARPWSAGDVGSDARLRLYRAVATEHYVLGAQDTRIRVSV